jgi:hypothetical protein
MLSHWRLGWLLAALLWVIEFRPPVAAISPALVGTFLHPGSSHLNNTPAATLLEQNTFNQEAIAPCSSDTGNGLLLGAALLPNLDWECTKPLVWLARLSSSCVALPALFRQKPLLIAILPNAP